MVSCKAGGLQRRGTLKSCIAQSFHHIIGTTLFYIRQEFLPAYFFLEEVVLTFYISINWEECSRQANSLACKLTKAPQLPKTSTHKFTNSPTPKPINSKIPNSKTHQLKTHQLKNSPTQKLKSLSFILQYRSNFRSVLARILAIK